eukprot:14680674-Alexandrium_andersonii.AAC.1
MCIRDSPPGVAPRPRVRPPAALHPEQQPPGPLLPPDFGQLVHAGVPGGPEARGPALRGCPRVLQQVLPRGRGPAS